MFTRFINSQINRNCKMLISPIGYNNYYNGQNSCIKSKRLSFGSENKYKIPNIFRNNKTIGKNNYEIRIEAPPNGQLKLGQIRNLDGSVFVRDTTYYARDDLDWFNLGQYLSENFPHIEDFDIHCFGCSSGEEAYTIAILLKHLYGQNTDFKIKASDIRDEQIEENKKVQKDRIRISLLTHKMILKGLGVDFDESTKYFYTKKGDEHYCYIKPEIVNSVEFEEKNILTSLDDIDETRPSIIFCRNMWPYVNSKYYDEFTESLYEKLAPGSIIVLGDYDYMGYNCEDMDSFPHILENKFMPLAQVSNYGGHALVFKKSKTSVDINK